MSESRQQPPSYDSIYGLPPGSTQEGYHTPSFQTHHDNIIPPPPAILNGAYPTRVKCSNCGKIIRTVTVIEDSTPVVAWLMGALFCIMGFWCISCIPCLCLKEREITHMCPNCSERLGSYQM